MTIYIGSTQAGNIYLGSTSLSVYMGTNQVNDVVISRLATRLYGPGNNGETSQLTGDGTTKTYSATLVNESGASITTASVALQGWGLTTSGTISTGNTYDVTGNVEYPIGGTTTNIASGGNTTVTVPDGSHIKTDDVDLATVIPAGASFKINLSSTVPNGQKYIIRLGFAGVLTKAKKSLLKKVALFAVGDSIMTNNGGAVYNATASKCPAYHASITGTTAATYGASSGVNFTRQTALAATLGVTHVVSNWGTNDFGAGTALATLQGYITTMRDMVRASSMKWVHTTMLPRTKASITAINVTTMTSSGTTMTATVADASQFMVGMAYTFSGANQAEYNGTHICTSINTGANTVSFLFIGSGTTPATGTITLIPWKVTMSPGHMSSYSGFFDAGSASSRGLFNTWVRSGVFDGYMEWADSMEPSRDAGRWKVAGEDALLAANQTITVSSVISTSRWNSDYNRGTNTIQNGIVQAITGANAGILRSGSSNTNGDITVSSAWTNTQQVGDTYSALPGISYISDDGTHPRVASGSKGGQAILDAATTMWIDAALI
jgi:hypothetical protein